MRIALYDEGIYILIAMGIGLKRLAAHDQPRERLVKLGVHALSNAELIAVLLRSGSRKYAVMELARKILSEVDNNLSDLGRLSSLDLQKHHGVGRTKALSIVAAMELGRRRRMEESKEKGKITSSNDAYTVIAPLLEDLRHEEFWIILLNRANLVIGTYNISKGGVSGTVADPKVIFQLALENVASSLILCHNHPSGNLRPSTSDEKLTKKIVEAGHVMDLKVLDHVIVCSNSYFSFADEGLI